VLLLDSKQVGFVVVTVDADTTACTEPLLPE